MTLKQFVDSRLVTLLLMSSNEERMSTPLLPPSLTCFSEVSQFVKPQSHKNNIKSRYLNKCLFDVWGWLNYTVAIKDLLYLSILDISQKHGEVFLFISLSTDAMKETGKGLLIQWVTAMLLNAQREQEVFQVVCISFLSLL